MKHSGKILAGLVAIVIAYLIYSGFKRGVISSAPDGIRNEHRESTKSGSSKAEKNPTIPNFIPSKKKK